MAGALGGMAVLAFPAGAQAPEPDELELEVEQVALFAAPVNDAIPDTIMTSFPPQVVCLVFPDACLDNTQPVRDPITGALLEVDRNDDASPVHPIPPDSLAVSFLGGNLRYESALQFEVPRFDTEIESFVLELPQGQPSYSFDSPLFQEAVFEAVKLAGSQDHEAFRDGLIQALEEEDPVGEPLLGIEACPLTVPIPSGAEPPQAESTSTIEAPTADGGSAPAIDCLFGTNGSFDGESQTWSFDLTFMVEAWNDFTLPNHGILFRPVGAPNLAFGDPDTSTNIQVVMDASEPPTALVTSREPTPEPTDEGPEPETQAPAATTPPPSTPPSTGTAPSSTTPSSNVVLPPPTSTDTTPPAPPPAEVAPPAEAPPADEPVASVPVASEQGWPWSWLLVLPFFGGAWLTMRSLTEELVTAPARTGALTRLVDATS